MGFQFKMERINLFILRGMSLISKFVLLFVLAGKGNEQLVFTYGLLFSLVTYVTYFLSFDLYTYTTREFISTPLKNKYTVLYQHIMSSLLISLISLPLIGLLFYFNVLDSSLIIQFYIIVILEFLCAEIYRLLVASKMPNRAVFYLFLRGGGWTLVYSLMAYFDEDYLSISGLLSFWIAGMLGTLCIGFLYVYNCLKGVEGKKHFRIDVFYKGIFVAVPILISTLSIRGVFTLDRVFISNSEDLSYASSYVFFSSVSSAIIALVDSGVLVKYMPLLIESCGDKYLRYRKRLLFQTFFLSVILSFLIFVFVCFLMRFESYSQYKEFYDIFVIGLLSAVLFSISQSYSVVLYVNKKDFQQLVCNMIVFLLGILAGSVLDAGYIPFIVLLQCFTLLVTKISLVRRLPVKEF